MDVLVDWVMSLFQDNLFWILPVAGSLLFLLMFFLILLDI